MAEKVWYAKINGKILGPFSLAQLQAMCDRGRLHATDQISLKKGQWQPAGQMSELSLCTEEESDNASVPIEDRWFYQKKGRQMGPVSMAVLQQMLTLKLLTAKDMVRAATDPVWRPASLQPNLRSVLFSSHDGNFGLSETRRGHLGRWIAASIVAVVGGLSAMVLWKEHERQSMKWDLPTTPDKAIPGISKKRCPSCKGDGKLSRVCSNCSGGRHQCDNYRDVGIIRTVNVYCRGGKIEWSEFNGVKHSLVCPRCNGTGFLACPTCNGTIHVTEGCSRCGGEGEICE
jgi:hypothetical protein